MTTYGPVTIGVEANNDCWRYYESGILTSETECAKSALLDHAVVIVGIDRTGETPYWIIQNSWGTGWGIEGFIYLAVEEGQGVSGMNLYAQWVWVNEQYPEAPIKNCPGGFVDESQNEMGWGRCSSDSDCSGYRQCSAWGMCMGHDYCNEPIPDLCAIIEIDNELGEGRCGNSLECKGDRTCSVWCVCEGEHNCTY